MLIDRIALHANLIASKRHQLPNVFRQIRFYGMLLRRHEMSRRLLSEGELRRRAGRILKSPVPDYAWQLAVKERVVSEVRQSNDVQWLAQELQSFMDIVGPRINPAPRFIPERRQRRAKTIQSRQEAISQALAAIARQSETVRSFRESVLNGQILRFEDIEHWIERRRRDADYPHAILVRLKTGFKLCYQNGWQLQPPLISVGSAEIEGPAKVDGLAYARPCSKWTHYVPVGRDGTLRVVYKLSKELADQFLWEEAQATVFLLADLTPLVQTELIQISRPPWATLPGRGLLPLKCLTRITITVDPIMTPKELAEEYAKLRAKLLVRKPRSQKMRHLELAVFAVKHPVLDKEAMGEWGRMFPKWRYSRVSIFARDARAARDRLLHRSPIDPWKLISRD